MTAIRIHFTYQHTNEPWGGANNFIRALHNALEESGRFRFVSNIEDDCDLIFMNQLGTGPAGGRNRIPLAAIRNLKNGKKSRPIIVVRAVNLNRHAFRMGIRNRIWGAWHDRNVIALLHLADFVIFQSEYQKYMFMQNGYRGTNNAVVHNGADRTYLWNGEHLVAPGSPLRFVSSTASDRTTKRHDLIARLSLIDGVEVTHLGRWPKNLATEKVQLAGTVNREQALAIMQEGHFFFHPAVKDPCPNVLFEAICAGLPVIFNPGEGSSAEIVKNCGIPLIEDNLTETVALARNRITQLQESVKLAKPYYTVSRSAQQYIDIFNMLMNSCHA